MTIIVWRRHRGHLRNEVQKAVSLLAVVGVTNAIVTTLQMITIQKIIVPYVIAFSINHMRISALAPE